MKRSVFFSIILLTAIGFTGCMKRDCGCDPDRDGDRDGDRGHDTRLSHVAPVLFQYEYYNYAWGFRHRGFLIDHDGRINGFEQPKKWIVTDSTGMVTKADLEYNLAQCDTICGKVDREELEANFRMIKDIHLGKILDNGMVMADAGTGVFSAWSWNERAGKYENVFFISNGDIYKINTHPDVKEIVEWLRKIGEKTNRFYWYGGY